MRSVTGTAPGMLCPSTPGDGVFLPGLAGTRVATIAAAAELPVARRKVRRVGFFAGPDESSDMGPPVGSLAYQRRRSGDVGTGGSRRGRWFSRYRSAGPVRRV